MVVSVPRGDRRRRIFESGIENEIRKGTIKILLITGGEERRCFKEGKRNKNEAGETSQRACAKKWRRGGRPRKEMSRGGCLRRRMVERLEKGQKGRRLSYAENGTENKAWTQEAREGFMKITRTRRKGKTA